MVTIRLLIFLFILVHIYHVVAIYSGPYCMGFSSCCCLKLIFNCLFSSLNFCRLVISHFLIFVLGLPSKICIVRPNTMYKKILSCFAFQVSTLIINFEPSNLSICNIQTENRPKHTHLSSKNVFLNVM